MSNILIIYASHFGRTRAIALQLAQALREAGHRVDAVDIKTEGRFVPPADYDAVILGSRVELGHFAREIVEYIRDHRLVLEDMPTGFFSVSMAASDRPQGLDRDAGGYCNALFEQVVWRPTLAAGFGGGLPYRQYNWIMRQVMRLISKNAGHTTDTTRDHVFTDEAAVGQFARRFALLCAERSSKGRADLARGASRS